MADPAPAASYVPRRTARHLVAPVRGLRYHLRLWGDPALATPQRPPLVMLHGWMDVGASFQFVVDALRSERLVIAPDWRGFGSTQVPAADAYWFADYLGDLDALLDAPALGLPPGQPIDLLGHSMGGNVAMLYAGVRPQRVRRLACLEGFGLPAQRPTQAPRRYAQWLDQLKQPARLRTYDTLDQVAERLRQTNPLLPADKAAWLATHWSRQGGDGRWHLLADPAHKRVSPILYRVEEVMACWECITAPMLWVDGDRTDVFERWFGSYPRSEFDARLAQLQRVEKHRLSPAGHMLHHDQPEALADCLEAFLDRPDAAA